MGTYFNPSNEGFRKSAQDEIYIDKSGLLNILNKKLRAEKNCISVSHARRFGKSQAAEMIDAYYSRGCDSKEIFSNLEISAPCSFRLKRKSLPLVENLCIQLSLFGKLPNVCII